jgi:sulfite exporter TauE/SafE
MSLRGFHIFFITLVTLLSFGITAIAFTQGYPPRFTYGCAAFGVLVVIYGIWFIRKSRKLIL